MPRHTESGLAEHQSELGVTEVPGARGQHAVECFFQVCETLTQSWFRGPDSLLELPLTPNPSPTLGRGEPIIVSVCGMRLITQKCHYDLQL